MHKIWSAILIVSISIVSIRDVCDIVNILLLIPSILTLIFYLFRNQQCSTTQSRAFFSGFRIGGHRGSPWKEPENSIASFARCKSEGCHLVEFDIEVTKDGVLIIMHDETSHRTTDKSWVLANHTLEEIKGLKLKFIPPDGGPPRFGGDVPTLAETVMWCRENNIKMLFDVKHFGHVVIESIAHLFRHFNLYETAIVSGFNPLVPYFVKRRDPRILTGYTWRRFCYSTQGENDFSPKHEVFWNCVMELLDQLNHQLTDHFLLPLFLGVEMVLVNHCDISMTFVNHAMYHGLQTVVWTSNDPIEARWFRHYLKIPFLTDSMDAIRALPKDNSIQSQIEMTQPSNSLRTSVGR